MLQFLRGKASNRKLRLFAVACCRPFWPLLTEQCSQDALLVAERFADGLARADELAGVRRAMTAEFRNRRREEIRRAALAQTGCDDQADARAVSWAGPWDAAKALLRSVAHDAAIHAANAAAVTREFSVLSEREAAKWEELGRQETLLRDLMSDPFRKPHSVNRAWLAWSDSCAEKIAAAIYADRAFDRLPILADALEDAGCDNDDILAHCRGRGPHVRGCWVLDLIVGKH
jgi:hypothetical protein